jgi:hypothetical protein
MPVSCKEMGNVWSGLWEKLLTFADGDTDRDEFCFFYVMTD